MANPFEAALAGSVPAGEGMGATADTDNPIDALIADIERASGGSVSFAPRVEMRGGAAGPSGTDRWSRSQLERYGEATEKDDILRHLQGKRVLQSLNQPTETARTLDPGRLGRQQQPPRAPEAEVGGLAAGLPPAQGQIPPPQDISLPPMGPGAMMPPEMPMPMGVELGGIAEGPFVSREQRQPWDRLHPNKPWEEPHVRSHTPGNTTEMYAGGANAPLPPIWPGPGRGEDEQLALDAEAGHPEAVRQLAALARNPMEMHGQPMGPPPMSPAEEQAAIQQLMQTRGVELGGVDAPPWIERWHPEAAADAQPWDLPPPERRVPWNRGGV